MKTKIFYFVASIIVFINSSFSQVDTSISLKTYEDSLVNLQRIIYDSNSNIQKRLVAYNTFVELLRKAINKDDAFIYPFDSLKHLGKIVSEDKKVRVFTMNFPMVDGTQIYNGFIQVRHNKKSFRVIELVDNKKGITDPINEQLLPTTWFGGLYYSIISKRINGQIYYILLGVDFNNLFSSRKVIDVLSFKNDFSPQFGAPIFKVGKNNISRVIFEYSSKANMILRYLDKQDIIVFDHLSPSQPEYTGNFQFYGPDFTYDGFRFDKNAFTYIQDLDLRNPSRDAKTPINAPEKLPEPGFLYKSTNK